MMDNAAIYEHLVCLAFRCQKGGFEMADAGAFTNADSSTQKEHIRLMVLVSIRILLEYQKNNFFEGQIEKLSDCYHRLLTGEFSTAQALQVVGECQL